MTPGAIAEELDRLRAAGERLRRRTAREVLELLARLLDGWRDPGSAWRRRLEPELAAATGFAPAMLHEGLALALAGWSGEALLALVARELGEVTRLETGPWEAPAGGVRVSGFETTSVLLAGALPTPSLLALLAPLVLRSPVLARPSSHDPVTARALARALAELDPELGACLSVVSFPSDDDAALGAFLCADCVVATGSDSTLASVAARVAPPRRLVGYGHRVSFAGLGPEVAGSAALRAAADRLSLDVALFDQLGCLSPVALFVVGDAARAARAGEALAAALAEREARWPRGPAPPEVAAAIAAERSDAELRAAAGRPVALWRSRGTEWTVIVEADTLWRRAPLHRFLRLHPVPDVAACVAALAPHGPHLAGVALEGFGAAEPALAAALARLGASRLCRFGSLQAPPLGWHHDGRGVLAPLARFCDDELRG